jgi:hypothetical protein
MRSLAVTDLEDMVNLFNIQASVSHQDKDDLSNRPQPLRHKDSPVNSYREYQVKLKKEHKNQRNLFDDLDARDKYWFNITRRHLKKVCSNTAQ